MSDLQMFRVLKKHVLLAYQKHYPYFRGNWKAFSSKDIRQLIEVIEQETNQRISEKWVYTYLKKENPEKLPRKDMLDILSQFAGFSGWDEFKVKVQKEKPDKRRGFGRRKWWIAVLVFVVLVLLAIVFYMLDSKAESKGTIETRHGIEENIDGQKLDAENRNVIEKPISAEKNDSILKVNPERSQQESSQKKETKPKLETTKKSKPKANKKSWLSDSDYQLILTNFMKSDLQDWKARKQQLDKMLSDNLEVVMVLKNGLGAEYLNKTDFAQKLIVPTETLKTMKIEELKTNSENEVRFIRIIQE